MNNYQSTGSRDPIWTQVSCDPEDGLTNIIPQDRVSNSAIVYNVVKK